MRWLAACWRYRWDLAMLLLTLWGAMSLGGVPAVALVFGLIYFVCLWEP